MLIVAALASLTAFSPFYSDEENICHEDMSIDYDLQYDMPTIGYEFGEQKIFKSSPISFKDDNGRWYRLESVAAKHFEEMVSAAEKAGHKIKINSAFRTRYEQRRLRRKLGDVAAKVGWSNHQSGTAVDIAGTVLFIPLNKVNPEHLSKQYCKLEVISGIVGYKCPTVLFWWLKNNGPKFGFLNTVEHEPWHFDYVGFKPGRRLVTR